MQYLNYLATIEDYAKEGVGQECITTFFRFLERNGCNLDTLPPVDTAFALQKGLVFSCFNANFLNQGIFNALYTEYIKSQSFKPADFSIVSPLSLFIALGVKNAELVDEATGQKHDFNVGWNRHTIKAEVIRLGENDSFSLRSTPSDENQADPLSSFLLVIDTNLLPKSFSHMKELLDNFFPQWPHISGVFAYIDHVSATSVGWEAQFFANPHAHHPFEAETLSQLEKFKIQLTVAKQYA